MTKAYAHILILVVYHVCYVNDVRTTPCSGLLCHRRGGSLLLLRERMNHAAPRPPPWEIEAIITTNSSLA
jgi:hypothetical protein